LKVISWLYLQHKNFLKLLQAVFTARLSSHNGYHSHEDFAMKLRRVFYWWTHHAHGPERAEVIGSSGTNIRTSVGSLTDRF
jgi:hypothetical protein